MAFVCFRDMFSLLFGAFYRRKATAEEGGAMWSSFTFLFVNLPRGRQRSRGGGLWKCVAARACRGWSVGRCYRRSCGRSTRLAQARLRFFPVSSCVLGWLLRCVSCCLVLFGCFYSQRGKSSGKNIFSDPFFLFFRHEFAEKAARSSSKQGIELRFGESDSFNVFSSCCFFKLCFCSSRRGNCFSPDSK